MSSYSFERTHSKNEFVFKHTSAFTQIMLQISVICHRFTVTCSPQALLVIFLLSHQQWKTVFILIITFIQTLKLIQHSSFIWWGPWHQMFWLKQLPAVSISHTVYCITTTLSMPLPSLFFFFLSAAFSSSWSPSVLSWKSREECPGIRLQHH